LSSSDVGRLCENPTLEAATEKIRARLQSEQIAAAEYIS
jgi:hypothetical protein